MLDMGWTEILVIGVIALIVVGPKDLPSLLRSIGQWVGKIRSMARDFHRTMNDAARDTEMSAFKDLNDIKKINPLEDFKKQAQNAQSFLNGSGDEGVTELESKPPEKPQENAKADAPAPAVEEEPDPGQVDTTAGIPMEPKPEAAQDDSETTPKAAAT